MDGPTFAAVIAAVLGAGGLGAFSQFRKAGREAESIATATLISVNDELRRELIRRDAEIAALRERVTVLETKL